MICLRGKLVHNFIHSERWGGYVCAECRIPHSLENPLILEFTKIDLAKKFGQIQETEVKR